jgi:tetratricopeptide (TPR) repeat protein
MHEKPLKILAMLVVLLALAVPLLLALEKIHESDVFWHLKTGEWILTHAKIPRVDSYSSTVAGKPWLDWEWLFQAAMYVVYRVGGFNALVIAKAVMAALTGLLIFETSRRSRTGALLAATVVMLAFVAARERLEMRPDLVLLLFAATTVAVLEAVRRGQLKWLWCLPLLQVIWVNCHASFALGIFLAAAYGLVLGVQFAVKRQWRSCGLVVLVLALTCGACLVNPYGIGLIEHAVAQTRGASPAGVIGEWQPTRQLLLTEPNWALRVFWWLFWLNPLFLIARLVIERRQFPWAHALVVAGMSALALRANRFTAVYAVVTAPILAEAAAQIIRKMIGTRGRVPLQVMGTAATGALAVFLIWVVVTNRWAKDEGRAARFGLGTDEQTVPFRALAELDRLSASWGLFNTFPSGGPLIWKSVPPWRVFTDGRANLYGREFIEQYRAAMRDPAKWEAWMRARGVAVVFVQYGTADDGVLLQYLAQSPAWSIFYFDQAACVFTRAGSEREFGAGQAGALVPWDDTGAVWQYARRVADQVGGTDKYAWGRAMATMGNFLMVCGKTEAAERLFNDAVAVNPRISEAWMNLGVIERDRRHFERALELTNQLLARNPCYYQARLLRAEVEAARGDVDQAVADVEDVLWRVPHSAQAWFKRAQLAAQQGDREKAIRSLQRVVAERVEDPTVYWFLGRLLAGKGRTNEAMRAYEDCLRVWVGSPEKKEQVQNELQKLRGSRPKL